MTTVLLVRHGLTALTGSVLAGWTPGVHLDERGRQQVAALAQRLHGVPLAAIVTSPLERCVETASALLAGRNLQLEFDERLGEVRYGEWTGRGHKEAARDPLWRDLQVHPAGVTFPGGDALRDVQARAVAAIRGWNERLGGDAIYVACSHADVIRAVVADALALHLDQFQRIAVDPASLTAIRYTRLRPFVLRVNDTGSDLAGLVPRKRRSRFGTRERAASRPAGPPDPPRDARG